MPAICTRGGKGGGKSAVQRYERHPGKHQGQPNGRDILPPMPWQDLKDATDADLKAIWAYLRSIPPIKNQVPFPLPPAAAK